MKKPKIQTSSQRGFTIIEVVISLSLFSLVIGLLYSGFWTSTKILTRDDSATRELEQRLLLNRVIPQWLDNATVTSEGNRSKYLYFRGKGDQLTFFSTQTHYTGTPVLYKFQILISSSPFSSTSESQLEILQKIERPFFSKRSQESNIQKAVFELGANSSGFSYLAYEPKADVQLEWLDEWVEDTRLPARVRLDLGNGNQIITSPQSTLDAECLSRRGIQGLSGRFCGTKL